VPAKPPDSFGPYEVIDLLGAGGMGEVYRARDPRLNRKVAIKVLARAGADPVRQRRLLDEAQAASALNHPNIITVYDVGTHDGTPYIVSELIEGTSLRELLVRGPLGIRQLLELGVHTLLHARACGSRKSPLLQLLPALVHLRTSRCREDRSR